MIIRILYKNRLIFPVFFDPDSTAYPGDILHILPDRCSEKPVMIAVIVY